MMKKSRALASAALALSLVGVLALAGCASGSDQKADQPSGQQTTQAQEPAEEVQLQIFAANSLSKAMEEAQALYTEQNPGVTFGDTQYEASGTLNEMLGAGQYADVLITASKSTMDTAVEKGYVDEGTRETMFGNDLVVVSKQGNDLGDVTLADIAAGTYTVAIGDESVPAGNYACQALTTVGGYVEPDGKTGAEASGKGGQFSAVLEPKVTLGSSVGNVCKYAENGDVDIALVYTSDVYRFGGVEVVSVVPNDTHKAITYPGAVCQDSEHAEAAEAFLTWCLTDDDCAKIWQKWGFELA
ncbi:MAG: extracellular solute-binding protein [Eggerthellaceae bacterium]|nr:extracellular solute-binding protein [Eggerthellaceae bacterium]